MNLDEDGYIYEKKFKAYETAWGTQTILEWRFFRAGNILLL